jgi:hypothetical protein
MPAGSYAGDTCGVLRRGCLRGLTPGMSAGSCEEHATSMLAAGCLRGLRIVLRSLRYGVPTGPTGVDSGTNSF